MIASVYMRFEFYSFFGHFSACSQRKYLITATVSKNRSVPVHELMQSVNFLHNLHPWAKIQMVGVS